jgi:hypothetical protein
MYPMVGPISMSKLRCFLDFTSWDRGIGWLGQVSPQQCTMISKSARKKPNANDVCMLSSVFNPLYLYMGWSHWINISKSPVFGVHFQFLVVICGYIAIVIGVVSMVIPIVHPNWTPSSIRHSPAVKWTPVLIAELLSWHPIGFENQIYFGKMDIWYIIYDTRYMIYT